MEVANARAIGSNNPKAAALSKKKATIASDKKAIKKHNIKLLPQIIFFKKLFIQRLFKKIFIFIDTFFNNKIFRPLFPRKGHILGQDVIT